MESHSQFKVELEQEENGPWIGEISALPGVMAYGSTSGEALTAVQALTLRVLADRLEHGEILPDQFLNVSFTTA
jgi:predicted RNase H-like HicB family nuclease